MQLKTLHHFCIQTAHYKESVEFYTKVLGFELIKEDNYTPKRAYHSWLKLDDFMIELQTAKCSKPFTRYSPLSQGVVHLSFLVEDAQAEYDHIKASGFKAFKSKHGKDVYKIRGGYQFKLVAPEGTEIEIRDSLKI